MNKQIKLNCPMCDKEFITSRRDKIWCDKKCSDKFRNVKKLIEINKSKQKRIDNDAFYYDFDLNKFFLKSFMPNKAT